MWTTNNPIQKEGPERISNGLILIAVGSAALALQLDWVESHLLYTFWPLLLWIHGLGQMAAGKVARGTLTLCVGSLFLFNGWQFLRVDAWPLALIALGVMILFGTKTPFGAAGHPVVSEGEGR